MIETYLITVKNSEISFEKAQFPLPKELHDLKDHTPMEIFCRMGEPESLECVVWKSDGKVEGIFSVMARGETCFYAMANSGLTFGLALGYFGKLCANARYGMDIFEEFGDDNA